MFKIIVQELYTKRREFTLMPGEYRIGRSKENEIHINDNAVSRHHAKLIVTEAGVYVEDLGSRNGTYVNGIPVKSRSLLTPGDRIQIGLSVLVLQEESDPVDEELDLGVYTKDSGFHISDVEKKYNFIYNNIARVIVGCEETIKFMIIALFCDGHVLIEDVPGVGKTVMAKALARSMRAKFKRIQFTPDLLPSDITGVSVFNPKTRTFEFMPGPIFSNIILADEINRTNPRTQSSLLECMAESRVTVDGVSHELSKPFFVIATQNPVDYQGTYPLPEAQMDRFLMRLHTGYPTIKEEIEILSRQEKEDPLSFIRPVIEATDVIRCQALIREVYVDDKIKEYIANISAATRNHPAIRLGCSPRGSLALMRASQGLAAISGRDYVDPHDVKTMALPVLSHRLVLRPEIKFKKGAAHNVMEEILNSVRVP